jgi:hypothetical protein
MSSSLDNADKKKMRADLKALIRMWIGAGINPRPTEIASAVSHALMELSAEGIEPDADWRLRQLKPAPIAEPKPERKRSLRHTKPDPESNLCPYLTPWYGYCRAPVKFGSALCNKHHNEKCGVCGRQAITECGHLGAFMCGKPLCGRCTCNDRSHS